MTFLSVYSDTSMKNAYFEINIENAICNSVGISGQRPTKEIPCTRVIT